MPAESLRFNERSVCLLDVDHFKQLNDRYGHLAGDALLASFGEILRKESRSSDLLGRYGGDEFIVGLPHTSGEEGRACMERVRSCLERRIFEDGFNFYAITCTIGIAEFVPGMMTVDDLVNEADKALYEAKKQGRNRIVVHHQPELECEREFEFARERSQHVAGDSRDLIVRGMEARGGLRDSTTPDGTL